MATVPAVRIRVIHDLPVDETGEYVLYWMIAFRRGEYNFSLQRAVEWARKLRKPLVILEALRADYQWASDRIHRFVIEGMADNGVHFSRTGKVLYYPYLEPHGGAGKGLLREISAKACVVISDDFPCFFLPRMSDAAAKQIAVRYELVDSNGLFPMRATDRVFSRAFDFRRYLQKELIPHLADVPLKNPLARADLPVITQLSGEIRKRWPAADVAAILKQGRGVPDFPVDHRVPPVDTLGGSNAAADSLRTFLARRLSSYATDRNQPEKEVTSGLSPYLHFGHISVHQVFDEVVRSVDWTPGNVSPKANGSSSGWWGTTPEVESFLDELITWRELGYNMCSKTDNYDTFESLPEWAQRTLEEHASDRRSHVYSLEQFELADTHDALWNAAQRQLVREGRIHNYLRMLWGKKILEWSASPREALDVMIELNNKYALDGRNPNSYSGICWVLGRYDRPWGPERPVYGTIRYMSSDNTARKVSVKQYLKQYAPASTSRTLFD